MYCVPAATMNLFLYAANHGLSTVALRYFTVYGPRQRKDGEPLVTTSPSLSSGKLFKICGTR